MAIFSSPALGKGDFCEKSLKITLCDTTEHQLLVGLLGPMGDDSGSLVGKETRMAVLARSLAQDLQGCRANNNLSNPPNRKARHNTQEL